MLSHRAYQTMLALALPPRTAWLHRPDVLFLGSASFLRHMFHQLFTVIIMLSICALASALGSCTWPLTPARRLADPVQLCALLLLLPRLDRPDRPFGPSCIHSVLSASVTSPLHVRTLTIHTLGKWL